MKIFNLVLFIALSLVSILGTASASLVTTSNGVTSYYHPSLHGNKTANGERYNHYSFTAAHRSLPFGTKLKVTDLDTQRSVIVKVNDRGPFIKGRVLDLSGAAASSLGIKKKGIARVEITVLYTPSIKRKPAYRPEPKLSPKPDPILMPDSIETLIGTLKEQEDINNLLAASY